MRMSVSTMEYHSCIDDTVTPPRDSSSTCGGARGVLVIEGGDVKAAFAAVIFMYVINHLIYARRTQLSPRVALSKVAAPRVYDASVHDRARHGVWGAYFAPLLPTGPGGCNETQPPPPHHQLASSSTTAMTVRLGQKCLSAIHYSAPWAVRAYYYRPNIGAPPAAAATGTLEWLGSYDGEWYARQRLTAAAVVAQHYRLRPKYLRRVAALLDQQPPPPPPPPQAGRRPLPLLLGMHIRGGDKARGAFDAKLAKCAQSPRCQQKLKVPRHGAQRRVVPPEEFLPFAEAFVHAAPTGRIFLATDDASYARQVLHGWPQRVRRAVFSAQGVLRTSTKGLGTFQEHSARIHAVNEEVLVDIYALSRADFILHAASAVAEAAIYLSPTLHNASVHLEYLSGRQFTPESLGEWARARGRGRARAGASPVWSSSFPS